MHFLWICALFFLLHVTRTRTDGEVEDEGQENQMFYYPNDAYENEYNQMNYPMTMENGDPMMSEAGSKEVIPMGYNNTAIVNENGPEGEENGYVDSTGFNPEQQQDEQHSRVNISMNEQTTKTMKKKEKVGNVVMTERVPEDESGNANENSNSIVKGNENEYNEKSSVYEEQPNDYNIQNRNNRNNTEAYGSQDYVESYEGRNKNYGYSSDFNVAMADREQLQGVSEFYGEKMLPGDIPDVADISRKMSIGEEPITVDQYPINSKLTPEQPETGTASARHRIYSWKQQQHLKNNGNAKVSQNKAIDKHLSAASGKPFTASKTKLYKYENAKGNNNLVYSKTKSKFVARKQIKLQHQLNGFALPLKTKKPTINLIKKQLKIMPVKINTSHKENNKTVGKTQNLSQSSSKSTQSRQTAIEPQNKALKLVRIKQKLSTSKTTGFKNQKVKDTTRQRQRQVSPDKKSGLAEKAKETINLTQKANQTSGKPIAGMINKQLLPKNATAAGTTQSKAIKNVQSVKALLQNTTASSNTKSKVLKNVQSFKIIPKNTTAIGTTKSKILKSVPSVKSLPSNVTASSNTKANVPGKTMKKEKYVKKIKGKVKNKENKAFKKQSEKECKSYIDCLKSWFQKYSIKMRPLSTVSKLQGFFNEIFKSNYMASFKSEIKGIVQGLVNMKLINWAIIYDYRPRLASWMNIEFLRMPLGTETPANLKQNVVFKRILALKEKQDELKQKVRNFKDLASKRNMKTKIETELKETMEEYRFLEESLENLRDNQTITELYQDEAPALSVSGYDRNSYVWSRCAPKDVNGDIYSGMYQKLMDMNSYQCVLYTFMKCVRDMERKDRLLSYRVENKKKQGSFERYKDGFESLVRLHYDYGAYQNKLLPEDRNLSLSMERLTSAYCESSKDITCLQEDGVSKEPAIKFEDGFYCQNFFGCYLTCGKNCMLRERNLLQDERDRLMAWLSRGQDKRKKAEKELWNECCSDEQNCLLLRPAPKSF